MTYARVIPRDLFNEGSLLNLLGMLALRLDDMQRGHTASLDHVHDGQFVIEQDPSDGSISCANVRLHIAGRSVHLYRPLNSRNPSPLWVVPNGDEEGLFDALRVFDDGGSVSPEFLALIQPGALPPVDGEEA